MLEALARWNRRADGRPEASREAADGPAGKTEEEQAAAKVADTMRYISGRMKEGAEYPKGIVDQVRKWEALGTTSVETNTSE